MSNVFNQAYFAASQNWDVTSFFSNSARYVRVAGAALLLLLGATLVVFGGFKIFRAITGKQGQGGPQWLTAILAFIFGGMMIFGSMNLFLGISGGGNVTVNKLGNGGGGNAQSEFNSAANKAGYDTGASNSIQGAVNATANQLNIK